MSHHLARVLWISVLLMTSVIGSISGTQAAEAAELRFSQTPEQSHSAPIDRITGERETVRLNGQNPDLALRFDLSESDTIETMIFSLSAKPLPGTDPGVPMIVRFNGGHPIQIDTLGLGFETDIPLDVRRARPRGNVLELSVGADCTDLGGGYVLSLGESELRLTSRPKRRRMQMKEIEERLSTSVFAPDRIGLIAAGSAVTRLEALGAQAIGLRMPSIPTFTTDLARADFSLIMKTRAELTDLTNDQLILTQTGPQISTDIEHPDRLYLTGDTELEVLQAVQAFAGAYLPQTRRSETTPAEIVVQSPLDYNRTRLSGISRLDSLSVDSGAVRNYVFDIADPAATDGELLLRLKRDTLTRSGTRLRVDLNGNTLGETRLNTSHKAVSFTIPDGALQGSQNQLVLTTIAAPDSESCDATEPFVAIGAGSRLNLFADVPSAPTDLSRLAADGSVFANRNGANTVVQLPDAPTDYHAALRLIAKLGFVSGRGWTEAEFVRGELSDTNRHILSIAPADLIGNSSIDDLPRALQSVLNNKDNGTKTLRGGGVAALFPGKAGQLVGVMSNAPGTDFSKAAHMMTQDRVWHKLSGSVTRWDGSQTLMTQSAVPAPGIVSPDGAEGRPNWRDAFDVDIMNSDRYSLAAFGLKGVDIPIFDLKPLGLRISEGWAALVSKVQPSNRTVPPAEPNFGDDDEIAQYRQASEKYERIDEARARRSGPPVLIADSALSVGRLDFISDEPVRQDQEAKQITPRRPELRGAYRVQPQTLEHHIVPNDPFEPEIVQDPNDYRAQLSLWWKEGRSKIGDAVNMLRSQSHKVPEVKKAAAEIKLPNAEPIRVGNLKIPVSLVVLILTFVLAVIGLIFVSPPMDRSARGPRYR